MISVATRIKVYDVNDWTLAYAATREADLGSREEITIPSARANMSNGRREVHPSSLDEASPEDRRGILAESLKGMCQIRWLDRPRVA